MSLSWIELKWLHGTTLLVFVIAPYFLGAFRSREALETVRFRQRFTLWGFLWAAAPPAFLLQGYYVFIGQIYFSLGRWPRFGENLSKALMMEEKALRFLLIGLVTSLYPAALALLVCACVPKWRHVAVYVAVYAASVGIAFGSVMYLTPKPFITWLLD